MEDHTKKVIVELLSDIIASLDLSSDDRDHLWRKLHELEELI